MLLWRTPGLRPSDKRNQVHEGRDWGRAFMLGGSPPCSPWPRRPGAADAGDGGARALGAGDESSAGRARWSASRPRQVHCGAILAEGWGSVNQRGRESHRRHPKTPSPLGAPCLGSHRHHRRDRLRPFWVWALPSSCRLSTSTVRQSGRPRVHGPCASARAARRLLPNRSLALLSALPRTDSSNTLPHKTFDTSLVHRL